MYQKSNLFSFHSNLQTSENCKKFLAVVSLDFLSFFTSVKEFVVKDVGLFLLGWQPLKAWMSCKMWNHPLVQIFDVRNIVEETLEWYYDQSGDTSAAILQLTPLRST